MELLDNEQVVENLNDLLEYQVYFKYICFIKFSLLQKQKIEDQRTLAKNKSQRYISYIESLQIPSSAIRALKFLLESWAD